METADASSPSRRQPDHQRPGRHGWRFGLDLSASSGSPARAVELVGLLASDAISSKQGKQVLAAVLDEDKDPAQIVEEKGMKQVSDTGALEAVIDKVLADNPDKVARLQRAARPVCSASSWASGKATRGQGNPKLINQISPRSLNG